MKWGIMATGSIAKKFAETINKMCPETELCAVASRNKERSEAFAKEHNITKAYDSYEALCLDGDVEVIYIATPNNFHFENAMLCLEQGKHVLCEKPFTTKASDAEILYQKAKEKGLFIMDALWIEFLPLLKKLEELISDGVIGQIKHLRADYGFVASGTRKDRKFASELGGGALLDVGVYNIGFAKMIMKDQPLRIVSGGVTINEYGTDEFSTIILEYPDKRSAALTTSIGLQMETEGVIYGSKGSIYLPNYQHAQTMTVKVNGQEPYDVEMPFEINGFEYQIREAESCISCKESASAVFPPKESLDILQTMDEIRRQWDMKFSFEK